MLPRPPYFGSVAVGSPGVFPLVRRVFIPPFVGQIIRFGRNELGMFLMVCVLGPVCLLCFYSDEYR